MKLTFILKLKIQNMFLTFDSYKKEGKQAGRKTQGFAKVRIALS